MSKHIYFIESGEYIKIGVADDPLDRLSALQTGNPHILRMLFYYAFEKSEIIEKLFHFIFSEKRIRGEWFSLVSEDIIKAKLICSAICGDKSGDFNDTCFTDGAGEVPTKDFEKMVELGWRPEITRGGRYWQWRTGSGNKRRSAYGGKFETLPEDIKLRYFADVRIESENSAG